MDTAIATAQAATTTQSQFLEEYGQQVEQSLRGSFVVAVTPLGLRAHAIRALSFLILETTLGLSPTSRTGASSQTP
jgi:hypothetical protein